MATEANTIFLRLEGPLQAWGDNSKFVIRRTMEAPTKSGVIGLICNAMGLTRYGARDYLARLNQLVMGVRIDRPGIRWWDYHTVGAGYGLLKAEGGIKETASIHKPEPLLTRREYLCDASFLVALQGHFSLIKEVQECLAKPKRPVYLGRKCCPPAIPVGSSRVDLNDTGAPLHFESLEAALISKEWRPQIKPDTGLENKDQSIEDKHVDCLIEWRASADEPLCPPEAEVWYDVPLSLDPPSHGPRFVKRLTLPVKAVLPRGDARIPPRRPSADYRSKDYTHVREKRMQADQGLCVFCKSPATTVHHATYRRAGGDELTDDLRSLCRLCHDAVTMIEYKLGMGIDRIDPSDPKWRDAIIAKRDEIRNWRSMEGRRRSLRCAPASTRREVLEED
jgi:CRISPR system Cascade subunit CasD